MGDHVLSMNDGSPWDEKLEKTRSLGETFTLLLVIEGTGLLLNVVHNLPIISGSSVGNLDLHLPIVKFFVKINTIE